MSFRSITCAIAIITGLTSVTALQASPEDTLTPRERIWLDGHNKARAEFGSEPMLWNPELAQEAVTWARYLAKKGYLKHSTRDQRGATGENLWMGTRKYFTPAEMVRSFVSESRYFVEGRFPQVSRTGRTSDVGHYTQIVWPETTHVGCALATGARYDVLVCRYSPPGNIIGRNIAPKERVARAD